MTTFNAPAAPAWSRLLNIAREIQQTNPVSRLHMPLESMNDMVELGNLILDWSHQRINDDALAALFDLARELHVEERFQKQLAGGIANLTEHRPVLHAALRGTDSLLDAAISQSIGKQQETFITYAESIRDGSIRGHGNRRFTDVLHIGIGGSHLGPKLLCESLHVGCSKCAFSFER